MTYQIVKIDEKDRFRRLFMKLNELSPSEVFSYFEKICSIPHGSGNTGMIADYCLEFAKLHGLKAGRIRLIMLLYLRLVLLDMRTVSL